jgi:hypothetical protein
MRDILEAITSYRKSKHAEEGVINDLKDGQLYKEMVSQIDSDLVFTLCFNTDGAQLYSFSHVHLWPIFLVINELPPRLRFSRVNMITWGLWQSPNQTSAHILLRLWKNLLIYDVTV